MMMGTKMQGSIGSQGQYGTNGAFKPGYSNNAGNESPTRRFNKPIGEAKISSDLLGAGDDPMAKN